MLILQEKLEEKDRQLQRLKPEQQQRNSMEEKTDLASDRKLSNEVKDEADN